MSHFQITGKSGLQLSQLNEEFEPHIAKLFNQSADRNSVINTKLDLRDVIILDSQSTIDIFCNQFLVEKTNKSKNKMRLKRNGGTMTVSHKATVTGYPKSVWFREKTIMKIIALNNLRLQYLVTYNIDEIMSKVKPTTQFQMNESGLHYFNPRDEDLLL